MPRGWVQLSGYLHVSVVHAIGAGTRPNPAQPSLGHESACYEDPTKHMLDKYSSESWRLMQLYVGLLTSANPAWAGCCSRRFGLFQGVGEDGAEVAKPAPAPPMST